MSAAAAVDLDEPSSYAAVDASDALRDVEGAASQWERAAQVDVPQGVADSARLVVVTGMGGSGVVGDLVAALAADAPAPAPPGVRGGPPGPPVVVFKGYGLPLWAGRGTLVVAVSCSGTTEETRDALRTAVERRCQVLAVAGGGPLLEEARAAGGLAVAVPWEGTPPRHSLGLLLVPVLRALGLAAGLDEATAVLAEVVRDCGRQVPASDNLAKRVGGRLAAGGVPLVWGAQGLTAPASYRLRCQLAENAKLPSLWGVLPELDHNDVVAWQEESHLTGSSGLVRLRDPLGEPPAVAARFDVSTAVLGDGLAWSDDLVARGASPLARLASLVQIGDLVSVYAALARGHDPTPIPAIDRLKRELAAGGERGAPPRPPGERGAPPRPPGAPPAGG